MLTNKEKKLIEYKKNIYVHPRAVVIDALKIVQKRTKWISNQSILDISKILKLPISEIESIATFYSQIFRKPVGKHIIKYCNSVVCYIMGYKKIKQIIINTLKIQPGETSLDNNFTLIPICCLGNCNNAPTIMINDNLYSKITTKTIIPLLESYR